MDSIREQMDMADEISNAISAPMIGIDLDDVCFFIIDQSKKK
jgi:hypothetical protein